MSAPPVAPRYRAPELAHFAALLLARAGLPEDRARVVAEVLLEGDLLGHTTHGLDLLPRYLKSLDEGGMARHGEPEVLADAGAALTWDGRHLPGPWLVKRAVAEARDRLAHHPQVSVAIRRSHHIGALQAYLQPVTEQGLVILLTCSDPSVGGVAPHGAVASVITPNPLAAGLPSAEGPILFDVSMSTTTNAMTRRVYDAGGRLPGPWLVDREGRTTDDPAVLYGDEPGAMLPLGGLDLGHKGFALALLVEALTSGLGGHGRADAPRAWGASVFLQLIDPERFAGRAEFERQMAWVARECRTAAVAPGRPPVRLPGEAALGRRARQLAEGVTLPATTMPALEPWARRLEVELPRMV
ncbi:MAG TPA: Ldh family oxidoreductase [Vicinamibacteria bacterium]|nr:Ldh family oxidoreductase [Vicinamibacteria bacterium]